MTIRNYRLSLFSSFCTLKMESAQSIETCVNIYKNVKHHIPEDSSFVCTVTVLHKDSRRFGVRLLDGARNSSFLLRCLDKIWIPPRPLCGGNRGSSPSQNGCCVKSTSFPDWECMTIYTSKQCMTIYTSKQCMTIYTSKQCVTIYSSKQCVTIYTSKQCVTIYTSKIAFIRKSWCIVTLKDKLPFTVALTLKSIFVKWALRKRSSRSWNAIAHRFMTRLLEPILVKLHMKSRRKMRWTSTYKLSLHGGRFELGKKAWMIPGSIQHKYFIKNKMLCNILTLF